MSGVALCITMPAIRRMAIMAHTIRSWRRNLQGVDWDKSIWRINVDPVGEESHNSGEYEKLAGKNVVLRLTDECSFSAACKWLWSGIPESFQYALHLEDDWELRRNLKVADLVKQINGSVVCCNVKYHGHSDVSLSPGLWSASALRTIGGDLKSGTDPEQQVRESLPRQRMESVVFQGNAGGPFLIDLGRDWRKANGLLKQGCGGMEGYFDRYEPEVKQPTPAPPTPPLLSILICHLAGREEIFKSLMAVLRPQVDGNLEVEVRICKDDGTMTIGAKRQKLLTESTGIFIVYLDDDDEIPPDYARKILVAIKAGHPSGPLDCIGIDGYMTHNGGNAHHFSTTINPRISAAGRVTRGITHINPVRRELALKTGFDVTRSHGEDMDYTARLRHLLQTEYHIPGIMYHYRFSQAKEPNHQNAAQRRPLPVYKTLPGGQ